MAKRLLPPLKDQSTLNSPFMSWSTADVICFAYSGANVIRTANRPKTLSSLTLPLHQEKHFLCSIAANSVTGKAWSFPFQAFWAMKKCLTFEIRWTMLQQSVKQLSCAWLQLFSFILMIKYEKGIHCSINFTFVTKIFLKFMYCQWETDTLAQGK